MPTVLRLGSFRFFFYSNEFGEPPHIHIQDGTKKAKFWLEPVRLASSVRFTPVELRKLERLTQEHQTVLKEAWNEYFDRK